MQTPPFAWFTPLFLAVVLPAAAGEAPTSPSRHGKLTSRRWAYGIPYSRESLAPVANPNPRPEPQPRRDHPFDVAVSGDGRKVYVSLEGSELEPGSEVAVYDVAGDRVLRRILLRPRTEAGQAASSPFRLALHPGGRFLLVTSRLSNFASVIDTREDEVISEIPADFYCQGAAFDREGRTAYVSNRYLDQILVLDIQAEEGSFMGSVRELGGLDDRAFLSPGGIHEVLARRCGAADGCHSEPRGGLYTGPDARESFLSVIPHVEVGDSAASRLLRAATPVSLGGYADLLPELRGHAHGTVVFKDPESDADYRAIAKWIDAAPGGPGISVGNPRSKPKICALSPDERHLFVGNTGTQDISIVETRSLREVGAIYIQNVVNDLKTFRSSATGRDYLIVSTLGVGFGVARERDPFGGESWDRSNPAAQFSLWRDLGTGRTLSREEQEVLGPFDAVDGTAAIKFRDIQNDLVFIDLTALPIPDGPLEGGPSYLLLANRYEAHKHWVRYTSDTAESTFGDVKGDIPPDLMRVVGAFPEKMALVGDRLFVTMQGSNEVASLRIQPAAADPSDYLVPERTYVTGLQPVGIAAGPAGTAAEGKLFVANFLGGTLSVIDVANGLSREVVLDPSVLARPVPATNAERGEVFVHTSIFSSDGDTSCFHCHYFDMGDGRPWGVSQVVGQEYVSAGAREGDLVIGGTMGVPQMRNLFRIQPFFLEGTLSAFEPRSMIMEHNPADDFKGPVPHGDFTGIEADYLLSGVDDVQSSMDSSTTFQSTLEERRDEMFRTLSMRYFAKAFTLRDFQRFVGEWQVAEPRLLPNPFDRMNLSVLRGRDLFAKPQIGCISCHPPPDFTRKDFPDNKEQAFPPLVTFTVRDGSFTLIGMNRLDYLNGIARDLEPWDAGRAEERQGHFTTLQLRGIWDRPPVFLHNGMARTLREVVATPGHPALRKLKYEPLIGGFGERPGRLEVGLNETFLFTERSPKVKLHLLSGARIGTDTHGGTSHLTSQEVDDLVNYLESIE